MKTKTIFKTLALAMLMPTMLLTTACSSDDNEIINGETANIQKGYPFPVTVNVTRQGDESTTRASYNESTRKLSFSAGDKLFVMGSHTDAGKFAGTLDYDAVSGKFSGTVTTENEYTGTIDDLMASAAAFLLPAGYGSYGFFSIVGSGSEATIGFDIRKAFALTKADAVEQFSVEYTTSYSSGFALAPMNAIASFTISGLTANKEVAVSFVISGIGVISGNVTTSAEGVATFAVGMDDYTTNFDNYSLTVDGNNIALPTKTTEAGHIYNISRNVYPVALSAVTADYLGSVVTTDGNVYATVDDATAASKTAAAVIAYVSSTGHGLAIALADESSTTNMGTLLPKINNMNHTPAVSGQTWKVPKEDEWKQMFSANGGSNSSYSGLNTAITNAGGSALQASDYWVAHNTSTSNMTKMTLSGGNATFGSGGAFTSYYVRVGFAF
jgi:hypothetical protein